MEEKELTTKNSFFEGNREYKSDVFSMLMEDPQNVLTVYNAVNHSEYKDPGQVEMCRLDRGISLSVRNDASFILDANLSIYEHQSTVCPNMPVRSLIYFSTIVSGIVKGKNLYGHSLIRIPTPRFVVFYNGEENQPEQYEMRLSDAYTRKMENPELELTCKVYNINYGKNEELLDNCLCLKEYMIFVNYVRAYFRKADYEKLEHCIELAIDRCIREGILRDFLLERRTEVLKIMTLDYTFERQITLERIEAREEGWEEGREEGIRQLKESIKYLRTGGSVEELRQKGISEDVINDALSLK